jgi:Mn-containing catalase
MKVSLEPVVKVSDKIKDLLNKAIAREIQVSIQYMWQHIQMVGVKGVAVQDKFQQTAIAEMKHAEMIAAMAGRASPGMATIWTPMPMTSRSSSKCST